MCPDLKRVFAIKKVATSAAWTSSYISAEQEKSVKRSRRRGRTPEDADPGHESCTDPSRVVNQPHVLASGHATSSPNVAAGGVLDFAQPAPSALRAFNGYRLSRASLTFFTLYNL